ncbi:MAG TPA: ABC transporter permease [Rhizomicrobium sp.]|jgi:putative ABC transport system permease protein|nr:ABC transporter permease [Rhizomicrobium sp.]
MFRNYLITALRNFTRHKLYSFINIAGLTVGLTCAIFIILFVRDELSYDKWIPGTENLYRLGVTFKVPGQPPFVWSVAPFPAPDVMLEQFPEVKAAAHLENYQMTVAIAERQFLDHVDVVSPNFFQIVQLPLIAGNRSTLFAQSESAVITESAAKKYFGAKPALGQMLKVGGLCEFGDPAISSCVIREATVMVTGVVRDLPHNTQLAGDVFIPNTSLADPMAQQFRKNSWFSASGWGYVELRPGADPRKVAAKIPALIDGHFDPRKTAGLSLKGSEVEHLDLTPFRDDHLSSDSRGSMTPAGSWTTVYGFAAIGVLILLIACFNFTNLATARAMVRAREISLRKVVGARRGQVMVQFLSESILMALLSLILAVALVKALLPFFDGMLGKPITFNLLSEWSLLLALVGVAVMVGLLGGLYPALVLSRFRPAATLRTNTSGQSGSSLLRTGLVVMQFAVSIGLGIAALVVFGQISYARNVDLGLNKDGIVVIDAQGLAPSTMQSLWHALAADPTLKGAALSTDVPFSGNANDDTFQVPGKPGTDMVRVLGTGPGFFSLYGVHLLSGRALSESHVQDLRRQDSTDSNIVINQTAAQRFGFSPQSALGKVIYADHPDSKVKKVRLTIVGVAPDFMFDGDRREIAPTVYSYYERVSVISVRVPAANISQGLSAIDRIWHAFAPSLAINRYFLDRDFEKQFLAEEQQGRIFGIFVGIAIFIAALGLFGLAAFSTERRTKEIGLRKTFGARTRDIVLMLLWQFSVPVLIANLIAWPVAYYYLHGWLESYAYRISLNPLYFIGAGVVALLIAWVTVFAHAQRVARANPIHALRYE